MLKRIFAAAVCALLSCSSGCVSVNSYVQDGYDPAAAHLKLPALAQPVRLQAEFRANGALNPKISQSLARHVEKTLRRYGVSLSADGTSSALLLVAVDDRFDRDQAVKTGIQTGFTFGHEANPVEDRYDIEVSLQNADGSASSRHYQPTMVTSGARLVPASYGPPYTAGQAFAIIIDHTLRSFLAELQNG